MSKQDQLILFKIIAVGGALFYLYHLAKANGGLAGNPYGVNAEKVANLASHLFPEEYRPQARKYGRSLIERIYQ